MQGSTLCYGPRVLLRIGLFLNLLYHCHNASLPPDRRAAAATPPKLAAESIGGVVYSSNSDRAEKQRNGKADHLPTSQEELIATPSVYTDSESPGEKGLDSQALSPPVYTSSENSGLDQRPLLTTATSSQPVYSSDNPGGKGLDRQPSFTAQASSPPVHSTENPGEKGLPSPTTATSSPPVYISSPGEEGLDGQPWLTTQIPTDQPTTSTPTTSEPAVVQPPVDVLLEFINASAVRISWSYLDKDQPNSVRFLVRYSHDGDPYVNAASQPTRESSYVFSGMLYGGYYQFQVVAIQGRVTSEPATTDYFINGITAPPGPPTHVRASALSPSEIDLEWDGPLSPTPLLYLIHWGDNLTNLDKVKEVYQSTHVTFADLEPGHTYYFQLRADISGRMSILTNPVSGKTYQIDLPPVRILVKECVVHTTWIVVKWSKPSPTRFPLPVDSFTVYHGERKMVKPSSAAAREEIGGSAGNNSECGGGSDGLPRSVSVAGDEYTVNVTQLDPGATYVFCVGYSSGKFRSDWSASQELSTLQDIACTSCVPYSSTEVQLKWSIKQSSSRVDLPPTLLVYDVTHTRTVVANYTLNSSEPWVGVEEEMLVGDLHPWRNYSFEVGYPSPVGLGAVWANCPTTHCYTLQGIPSAPPANVTILSVMATSVTLTWEAIPVGTLNGHLIGFTFQYFCHPRVTCLAQSCPLLHHRVPASEDEREMSYQFEDLLPFMNYTFEVAAETSAGSGPFSFSVTMETEQSAPSQPPVNITMVAVSETSFSLEWEEPPECSWNGVIIGYTLHVYIAIVAPLNRREHFSDFVNLLTNESSVTSFGSKLGGWMLQREISVPGTHANVEDLQPTTVYSITVAAATSEGIGPFSAPVIVSTLESVINRSINMNLSVSISERQAVECFSVNISWKQLLSQEAGLFLPDSVNNATVYGTWDYLIHFISVTPGINDSGIITVDDNDSFYTLTEDTLNQGTRYKLWITVDILLSNRTTLHIHSLPIITTQIPTCSAGPDNSRSWTVAAVVLVVFLLVLLAVCLLSVCLYRWLRKSPLPSPMLINMESYISDAVDSEEGSGVTGLPTADRQRGDGWNASSSSSIGSSEESIKSGSSIVTSEESADADSRKMVTGPGESGVGVATSLPAAVGTLLCTQPEHNDGYVRVSDSTSANERPLHDLPLAPRQQPDGCSISSSSPSSSQSSLLHCDA